MKMYIYCVLFLIFSLVAVPVLTVHFNIKDKNTDENTVTLYVKDSGQTVKTYVEKYIEGVVAAEMPAEFNLEALKAQAVAARTYMYQKKDTSSHLNGADVCSDFAHCQAYKTDETLKKQWGANYKKYKSKISDAVNSTKGLIMEYNGKPISAVFHSTSSGKTQNSEDVWGNKVPYLKSVVSDGDYLSPKYKSTVVLSKDEVKQKLNITDDGFSISDIVYSDGESVSEIKICGKKFSGTQIRTALGLNSACFDIDAVDGNVKFTVRGYGHGVGMSQYGANYMASQGKNYKEILKKYYSGIKIKKR